MSSETITITRLKCDRCSAAEDFPNVIGQDQWSTMSAQRKSGGPLTWGYKHDLCRACTAEIADWFRAEVDSDYTLTGQLFGPRGNGGPSFGGGRLRRGPPPVERGAGGRRTCRRRCTAR